MRVLSEDGTPVEISEEEILYFTNVQHNVYIHTKEGRFALPTTLTDLLAVYKPQGFERLDRCNVVNVANISEYDTKRKVVYFNESDSYTTVSEANERRVKQYLKERDEKESRSE